MPIVLVQYNMFYLDYKLSKGRCYYSPNNAKDCCLSFSPDSKCTKCTGGLQPNPSTGICQDVKIQGCIKKASNQGCEVCAQDYDLVNGKCIPSIADCTKYDQNNNCVACASTCVLSKGACVPVVKIPNILNCRVIT